jgi:hypothetical protein
MSEHFVFDVFLSHSSKDKAVVREVAERLRNDGLKVWFDEWEIKPGDSIPAKIEEGLERSRVLVLCMSANAFGSDWAQLEAGTFRFRDPLNKERRFIPLRLDDAPIKGSLAQFLYVSWRPVDRGSEYPKLLSVCQQTEVAPAGPIRGSFAGEDSAQKKALVNVSTVIGEANVGIAVSQRVRVKAGPRPTLWVLGSYSELTTPEVAFARKVISTLGCGLAARGVRLVSSVSDMLEELAAYYRNTTKAMDPRGPLPIILDGTIRQTNAGIVFQDNIGQVPDLGIVIGGGVSRGRVAEECAAAEAAGIPILPVPVTGGAAARLGLTAHKAKDVYEAMTNAPAVMDPNDVVTGLLTAVERYAPIAEREKNTSTNSAYSNSAPAPLTKAEINRLVNHYIGVNGGYLGNFTYRTHHDFYLDLDLDIDPYNYDGTTRQRFMKILTESPPDVQARILEGILARFPVGSSELRTHERHDQIVGWIDRLRA